MPLNEFYGLVVVGILLSGKSGNLISNSFKNEYKSKGMYSGKKLMKWWSRIIG